MSNGARKVTDEEIKRVQLEMLDEIDAFCRKNGIRYSLAFGTLLGAVRHKGYIPWDDDVDIIMPLPDMLRFRKEFVSENLMYCDVDTVPGYEYHFSRIAYKPTFSKTGIIARSYGISIDLYPVAGMAASEAEVDKFLEDVLPLYDKRKKMILWRKRAVRRLPVTTIPGFSKVVRRFRDLVLDSYAYEGAGHYIHAGSIRKVNVFDYDVFESMKDVPFEDRVYQAVGDTDRYLAHCFGDYMTLPPVEQRVAYHHFVYYWK